MILSHPGDGTPANGRPASANAISGTHPLCVSGPCEPAFNRPAARARLALQEALMSEALAVPVPSEDRLHHVDTLRGVALLGVLVMNLHEWFRGPMQQHFLDPHHWPGWWNTLTNVLLSALVSGKAMTTFAMLFAVGLCIQSERVLARGGSFKPYALRRLGILFLFGVLHILLVWNGDILHNYGMVGLLALPFLHRKPKTIYIWLFTILGLGLVGILVFSVIMALNPTAPWGPASPNRTARLQSLIQEMLQIRGNGSWTQEFFFRLREWNRMFGWRGELGITMDIFIKFLVGLAVWKSGILRDPSAHLPRLRRFFAWAAPTAVVMVIAATLPRTYASATAAAWPVFRWFLPLVGISQIFGVILMALAWGAGALLLLQKPAVRRALGGFTVMGRMALTNYLTQSVVMTFLFFGWGLKLYGKVGPFVGFAMACTFFALQVAFSRWWLARHPFGPMEWVWRACTYGRLPGRREPGVVLPAEPTTAS